MTSRHPTGPSRRLLLGALAAAVLPVTPAMARDTSLPVPRSLWLATQAAAARNEPLVLLASLPGCPYCELVRRSYLLPLRETGLQAWQLDTTDRTTPLTGFDRRPTTAAREIRNWKVSTTPTVLFFGPEGQELAERLVGATIPDFYGAYLDERVDTARKALLARK